MVILQVHHNYVMYKINFANCHQIKRNNQKNQCCVHTEIKCKNDTNIDNRKDF